MGVLRMKQVNSVLSTYTADVSGVCSALYEMGGMTVIHDASGCNSTYTTHDEPRWYDTPSMVYISALAEMEAMMGDEEKLIGDVCTTAEQLKPRFITLCGTPIPMMMGTDFSGIARLVERRTGIPTLGIATNGTHSYLTGISEALVMAAKRFCPDGVSPAPVDGHPVINLLGVTPLDFSVTGTVEALRKLLEEKGYRIRACWAMGDAFEDLTAAGEAHVNLVVSSAGLALAKFLRQKYGTPYVIGLPVGSDNSVFEALDRAAATGENQSPLQKCLPADENAALIIGESVWAASMRRAYEEVTGKPARILCPLEYDAGLLNGADIADDDESVVADAMKKAAVTIADPMYLGAAPGVPFVRFPHEGYSGRIWRKEIPVFVGKDLTRWLKSKL
ncbi:MAG: oxidoreductase [Oscillospiraceae bacterium]|nr:oxidoreductase [Oscillospiraceae bacterium]